VVLGGKMDVWHIALSIVILGLIALAIVSFVAE